MTREDMIGTIWHYPRELDSASEMMMVIEFDDNDCPKILVRRIDGKIEICQTEVKFSYWCDEERTFPFWQKI